MYRWAGQKLEYYQRLATKGAYDIEHFILEGSHYIAVINHFDHGGAGFGVDSMLYRYAWSNSEERNIFKPVQAISTDGGTACKHFEIRGQHFLAVANYFNGSHAAIKSTIYRIQRSDPVFVYPKCDTCTHSMPYMVYVFNVRNHVGMKWIVCNLI